MDDQAEPSQNYVWRVLALCASYGDAEAIVVDDQRFTYANVRSGVLGVANALRAAGVRPGATLAFLVANHHEAVYLQLGAHLLGCRTAWVAPDTPARHQAEFVQLAGVEAIVYDPRAYASAPVDTGVPVLCLGPGGVGPDLLATGDTTLPTPASTEPETLFQTGGTTGRPKLVRHTQRSYETILALTEAYTASGAVGLRHLAASCLWHVSGHVATLMTLLTGGTWYPRPSLEPEDTEDFLRTIEQERITSVFVTPVQLYRILDHPQLAKTDTSSLALFSVGGAPAAAARMAQAAARFGAALRPTYGATEAPFIAALPGLAAPEHAERMASCGQPYGNMRIEIRDEARTPVAPGTVGEVWVTGGLTMTGYWGEPALTAETLVDGWIRTGDLGYVDDEGYLFLLDRLKDLVITGTTASKIYSRTVEDRLAAHPDVRAAAIIGVPDDEYGSAVHAYVVRAPGSGVTPQQLRDWVLVDLNDEWTPRDVEFIEALPLTRVGKVDKKELRARYAATR